MNANNLIGLAKAHFFRQVQVKRLARYGLAILILITLAACESALMLEGVEEVNNSSVRRTDMFQATAGNEQALVMVGGMGVVLHSTDGGQSWQRQVFEGKPFLIDVAVCPNKKFIALDVSFKIWIGDASGSEWQAVPIDTQEALQALTCDQNGKFWVVGGFSTILQSGDEGKTWSSYSMDDDLHFTSVQFTDAEHGFVSGEFGALARTADGGKTWERLASLEDEFYPQDAFFQTADRGWVVGLIGTILHTEDGGKSWQRETTGTDVPLYGITQGEGVLYVVGGNGTVLTRPLKEGGQWTPVEHGKSIRFYLRAIHAVKDDGLLVGGGFGALHKISG